jgi:hypothetical protein
MWKENSFPRAHSKIGWEKNRYGSYLSNGAERLGSRNKPEALLDGSPTRPGLSRSAI